MKGIIGGAREEGWNRRRGYGECQAGLRRRQARRRRTSWPVRGAGSFAGMPGLRRSPVDSLPEDCRLRRPDIENEARRQPVAAGTDPRCRAREELTALPSGVYFAVLVSPVRDTQKTGLTSEAPPLQCALRFRRLLFNNMD